MVTSTTILYYVVLPFEPVEEILKCDHSNNNNNKNNNRVFI